MKKEIKIGLFDSHKEQLNIQAVVDEVKEIQDFFDDVKFDYEENTINFVFLNGQYCHVKRTILVRGVIVNPTVEDIIGIQAKLKLKFKYEDAQIAVATLDFPQEFIGRLKSGTGSLFHLEIPVRGLESDKNFKYSDIEGRLEDVELLKINSIGEVDEKE
ncbi:hypothetical protein [Vagococcus allomyrinae]|uniref:Uncharacterized protein n=1 Tax=Vagococcus allomyrinae TaxID=2794353 RepID=A0A940SWJ0_9ENTE|nr:hypothetical protein [Vagococcus allomyrinae]MBP1043049.1 hypothetical protein [Vagococcus allomyrinae]